MRIGMVLANYCETDNEDGEQKMTMNTINHPNCILTQQSFTATSPWSRWFQKKNPIQVWRWIMANKSFTNNKTDISENVLDSDVIMAPKLDLLYMMWQAGPLDEREPFQLTNSSLFLRHCDRETREVFKNHSNGKIPLRGSPPLPLPP